MVEDRFAENKIHVEIYNRKSIVKKRVKEKEKIEMKKNIKENIVYVNGLKENNFKVIKERIRVDLYKIKKDTI